MITARELKTIVNNIPEYRLDCPIGLCVHDDEENSTSVVQGIWLSRDDLGHLVINTDNRFTSEMNFNPNIKPKIYPTWDENDGPTEGDIGWSTARELQEKAC